MNTRIVILSECDGSDIIFRAVRFDKVSTLQRLPGRAAWFGGNPYALYGDFVKQWIQADTGKFTILVATFTSGSLKDFVIE